MSKICIMSDTHLSSQKYNKIDKKTGINKYMYRQFQSLDWVIDYLKRNNIKTIIHGGDMFDSAQVTSYPIKRAKDAFKDFNVFAIKGNHDESCLYRSEEMSALDLLDINSFNTPDYRIIDDINFVFIPWGYEIDEDLLATNLYNVLVTHGFPKDYIGSAKPSATNNNGLLSFNTKLFDFVITGHYHVPDEFTEGKTRYLNPGSLMSLNEENVDNSIWIFDTDTKEYERVIIPNAVKRIRVHPENPNEYLENIKDENIFTVEVDKMPLKGNITKAKRIALELQIRLNDETIDIKEDDKIDDFWTYVENNKVSYKKDFKNVLKEIA